MATTFDAGASIGDRVRAFRRLSGFSQADLAQALGVTQGQISHIESGRRFPPADFLDSLAHATGYPRSYFDPVPTDLPPLSLRYRKMAGVRSSEVHQAEQLVTEAYRVVWQLVRSRPGYIPPTIPTAAAEQISSEEIELLAAETREALGLDGDRPIRHVTRVLERAGVVVTPLSLTGGESEPGAVGHFGASCWPGPPDPAVIGYFEGGTGDRQRFTLAHELGHLVLHTRRSHADDPEAEANRFAGAFLVPYSSAAECVRGSITLRDFAYLKATWGVSIQALIMRAHQVGAIDDNRKTSLFKQISARGWRKNEPVVVHHERPLLLSKLLASQFGDGTSGYRRAAETLGLPALILANLAPEG